MRAGAGQWRGRAGRERDTGVARLWLAGDLDGLCRALEGPDDHTAARAAEALGEAAFGARGGAALIRCLERCEPLLADPDFGSYDHDRSWPLIEVVRALGRRREHPVVPPRVDYELTPLGVTLHDIIQALVTWTEEHQEEIAVARAEYDRRTEVGEKAS